MMTEQAAREIRKSKRIREEHPQTAPTKREKSDAERRNSKACIQFLVV